MVASKACLSRGQVRHRIVAGLLQLLHVCCIKRVAAAADPDATVRRTSQTGRPGGATLSPEPRQAGRRLCPLITRSSLTPDRRTSGGYKSYVWPERHARPSPDWLCPTWFRRRRNIGGGWCVGAGGMAPPLIFINMNQGRIQDFSQGRAPGDELVLECY